MRSERTFGAVLPAEEPPSKSISRLMDAYSRDLEMIEERMKWHRYKKAVEWGRREGLLRQGPNPGFWPEFFPEPQRSAWLTWQGEYADAREAAEASGIHYNTIWYNIKKIEKLTGQKFNQPREKNNDTRRPIL